MSMSSPPMIKWEGGNKLSTSIKNISSIDMSINYRFKLYPLQFYNYKYELMQQKTMRNYYLLYL